MIEQNNPVDIGKAEIAPYKDPVEEILVQYYYQGARQSLPALMQKLDPDERYVMNDLERSVYFSLREGLQIGRALYRLLSEKVGLRAQILAAGDGADDARLQEMRGFCGNYATYAASCYVSKRLARLLEAQGGVETGDPPDLSQVILDTEVTEEVLLKRLLAPLFMNLLRHEAQGEVFKTRLEFPVFVKEVFDHYQVLALRRRARYGRFDSHIRGYQFRILDAFVVLEGYEDIAVQQAELSTEAPSFEPIEAEQIVGNRAAKVKILRYIDRLALYDPRQGMNPIMKLGGLSWTNLFDGPPGTGKSSLFRLAMTRLYQRCGALELPCKVITVDQSIKDEFYGKTGKLLLQRLQQTRDPAGVSMVVFDDIDLLTSSRADAQGADNDINNIIMQYLDGVYTVRSGNVINFAASNKPTGLDDALRNRFSDRLYIDGPVAAEDFADMFHILGGKLVKRGLLAVRDEYTPFATQAGAVSAAPAADVAAYMAEEFQRFAGASVIEFGRFMADLKARNPKVSGRSVRAVMDAVLERSADFDVPEEWFADRAAFFERPFADKQNMLADLYQPITPDVLFQEAQRYFDSEQRYAATEADEQVQGAYDRLVWDMQAQLRFYQAQLDAGEQGAAVRVQALRRALQRLIEQAADAAD